MIEMRALPIIIRNPLLPNLQVCNFGGGGDGIPDPKPIPITPTRVDPQVATAKQNLREKMLRAQGRAASQSDNQPGFFNTKKQELKKVVG